MLKTFKLQQEKCVYKYNSTVVLREIFDNDIVQKLIHSNVHVANDIAHCQIFRVGYPLQETS